MWYELHLKKNLKCGVFIEMVDRNKQTEKTNINSCNLKITALWDCSIMGFCMVDWGIYSPSSLPN